MQQTEYKLMMNKVAFINIAIYNYAHGGMMVEADEKIILKASKKILFI